MKVEHLSRQLSEQLFPPQTAQERQFETLLQVSRAIGSILDLNKLMEHIVHQVTRVFGADRSTLYLHDEASGELWARVAEKWDHSVKELRIDDDQGICGQVFWRQQPKCVADTSTDSSFAKDIAERAGYVPRSILAVPIMRRSGQCMGVLQVMDLRIGHFRDSDISLLDAIAVQVGISLDNARLYEAQKRQFDSFVRAISAAVDARDPSTAIHSVNVANFAMGIAQILELKERDIEFLRVAGLLHDVGKIGVRENLLLKPGALTPEEYGEMKRHASFSYDILSKIEFAEGFEELDHVAASHHEALDGSGYPNGLQAHEIPFRARLLAVADVFAALTQDRAYRPGMSTEQALNIIDEMTPNKLDPTCVDALKVFLGRKADLDQQAAAH